MVILIKINESKIKIEETGYKLIYIIPHKLKTNAIEIWFSQFKYNFIIDNNSISFQICNIQNNEIKMILYSI